MTEPNHQSVAIVERGETAIQAHPRAMLQTAIERGNLDTAALEKLMELSERYDANEAKKAYARALVDLKRELPTVIGRDQTVDFGAKGGRVHYTHSSLAVVMDAITGPLTRFGFSLSWSPATEGQTVKVTCTLQHAQGHSESTTISAPIDRSGSKTEAQGVASTITLLERYSALSLLGIATADMPEPKGETPPEHIDTARNMRAAKACADAGHPREEIEAMLGKPIDAWTAADLDQLRAFLKSEKQK